MKTINIGLIGFGKIGSAVVEVMNKRRADLLAKTGVDARIVRICDKDLKSKRPVKAAKKLMTRNFSKVLYDPDIDIVVELIGGIHPAKDIILEAIRQGKHVVTANKALLSEAGEEIFNLANSCVVCVGFEASVGGGIPIIRALKEGLAANKLDLIYGIINGTSNFILTRMGDRGLSFKAALELAKAKGYAEKNPILDTGGRDSAHKLAILAYLGFGLAVKPKDIYTEGILDIDPVDIQYAKEFGYAIKLLAIAKRSGDALELRVHPTLICEDHLLTSVKGVYNAIFVKGDLVGEELFYGEGAGRYPTASAVISDIMSIGKRISGSGETCFGFKRTVKSVARIDSVKVRHYIRFSAIDKPGVLKDISGILAKHSISIASVAQKEERREKAVPIVMMTHAAQENSMSKALNEISRLKAMRKRPVRIRIED